MQSECVQDYEGFSFEDIQHETVNNAVKLAKVLGGEGFNDITEDEVNDFIDAHSETLTDENLLELTKFVSEEGGVPDPDEEGDEMGLTIKSLSEFLRTTKGLQRKVDA